MIDPNFAIIVMSTAAAAVGWGVAIYRAETIEALEKGVERQRHRADHYRNQFLEVSDKLSHYRLAEAKLHQQRVAAAQKGTAASVAAAKAKKAQADLEQPMRAAKTFDALAGTKFRSRAQVVAPVKAKRARAKTDSGAGAVAAKQG